MLYLYIQCPEEKVLRDPLADVLKDVHANKFVVNVQANKFVVDKHLDAKEEVV